MNSLGKNGVDLQIIAIKELLYVVKLFKHLKFMRNVNGAYQH